MKPCLFAGDTETTWYTDYLIDGITRVYLWHIRRVEISRPEDCRILTEESPIDEFIGYDAGSLVEWIELRKKTTVLWFHNLRYDGSYIVDWLLKHGYKAETYDEVKIRKDSNKLAKLAWLDENDLPGYTEDDFGNRRLTPIPGKVTKAFKTPRKSFTIIKSGSSWISLVITNARGTAVKLFDSGNKYTTCGSLEGIANAIGEPGKEELPIVRRDLSYIASPEDIERVKGDTRILAKAMAIMYDNGLCASTLAGDAWKTWVRMYKQRGITEDMTQQQKAAIYKENELDFKRCYPKLDDEFTFSDGTVVNIRDAYKGGVTYANPDFTDTDLSDVGGVDVNSEHPTSMRDFFTPVRKPVLSVNQPLSHLAIVHFHACAKLKPGMEPCHQRNNSFRGGEVQWLTETDPTGEDFTMTCDDFERFKMRYDISPNIDAVKKYYVNFYCRLGSEQFGFYIDHYTSEKRKWKAVMLANEKGSVEYKHANIQYYLAKIMMNALYGKFGQVEEKPYQWCELEGEAIKVRNSDVDAGEFFEPFDNKYLPTAIFTTSTSRCIIYNIDSIFDAYGITRYYKDTDSDYFDASSFSRDKKTMKQELIAMGLDIDESRLGALDVEHLHEPRARFIRAKAYLMDCVQKDGSIKTEVKCGGMPEEVKEHVTWDNFHPGAVFGEECGKLMPIMVNGGTVLKPVTYIMRD